MKKALILGITGQDGSYLADILLEKSYEVHGLIRRSATGNTRNIRHLLDRITLHPGDLADPISLYQIIQKVRPHEIYNEADQDHAGWSFQTVGYSFDITAAAVGRLLEIVRQIDPAIKFFQPVSSNMFGRVTETPQTEETPFRPQSPYACAKVCAFVTARYYRDAFGMFVATGIFYNHESPRRTQEYVSRKITGTAVKIALGLQQKLHLGDLSAEIDFGYSREYMQAAWSIMQLPDADDFIICTGETHTIRELLELAFHTVGLDPDQYVEIDPKLIRPAKTDRLLGDFSKARRAFGFNPQIRFQELVQMLIDHDMAELRQGQSK